MMMPEGVTVGNLGMDLVHEPNTLVKRLTALSQLQSIATIEPFTQETIRSTKALAAGLYSESLLVKQSCVFALGQSRYPTVVPDLRDQLLDEENDIGSRVQAARGLALLRYPGQEVQTTCDLLAIRYSEEESEILREAAEVSAARLGWEQRGEAVVCEVWNGTTDLAPPFTHMPSSDPVQFFTSLLHDPSETLFSRCRSMSNLRNLCITKDPTPSQQYTTMIVIQSLTQAFQTSSSVFLRYQLVLALAQIDHKIIHMFLAMQLSNIHLEDGTVRAAIAEALAGSEEEKTLEFLSGFADDENEVVRECVRLAVERAESKCSTRGNDDSTWI